MPYTPNSTWVDGSGGGTPVSAARLNNMEAGIWPVAQTYTPLWTSNGTQPVKNNGTLTGSYVQVGRIVQGWIQLTMGSTTTYGTGNYLFSLPATPVAQVNSPVGLGTFLDLSAGALFTHVGVVNGVTIVFVSTTTSFVGSTVPFTFAVGDTVNISFSFLA